MSEVTRVPLQPIEKGTIAKIWLALIALLLIGVGVAFAAHPRGVEVETLSEGSGPAPVADGIALATYVVRLANGTEIDRSDEPQAFPLTTDSGFIPGFVQGLQQTRAGGKYRILVPARLGYGAEEKKNPQTGQVVIPANSDLEFEVGVVKFMTMEEFQTEQMRKMQILQQMQQMQGGAPEGAPPLPGGHP